MVGCGRGPRHPRAASRGGYHDPVLHPSDIVAAKLLVQLGDVAPDVLRRELAAVDADPQGAVDLVARLARAGALDGARVTRVRRYVALFEHVRREAIFLRMVEKELPQLSKEEIGELIARLERSDYRTQLAAVLTAQGRIDAAQARALERRARDAMRREDLKVLERYRAQRFEGVSRPLVREPRVATQVFRVSTLFRSRDTIARVKKALLRLDEQAAPPPRDAQFEFMPAELPSGEEVPLDTERRRQLEQMDTARLKPTEPAGSEGEGPPGELRDRASIGPYEVVECIGQGGMGAVFLAQEEGVGPIVAVKVLLTERASDEDLARFRREAAISSLLKHPNTVTLLDQGETRDGLSYMAIPFFAGRDLKAVLAEAGGRLEPADAFHYFEQLLAGLQAVHEAGVVHRDLKPENCFVLAGAERQLKLVDLGIARLMDDHRPPAERAFRSRAGVISGTPAYIAPETITDDPIDARTDIYSAGILLYELLTGRNPLFAETPYDYLREHLVGVPLTLFQGRKDKAWHPELEGLVASMLAKEKSDRPSSCQAILDRLRGGLRARALEHYANPPAAANAQPSSVLNGFFKMFR